MLCWVVPDELSFFVPRPLFFCRLSCRHCVLTVLPRLRPPCGLPCRPSCFVRYASLRGTDQVVAAALKSVESRGKKVGRKTGMKASTPATVSIVVSSVASHFFNYNTVEMVSSPV